MSSFNVRKFKKRFTLYYIFKSTACITPIFFLFLQKQVHLNIAEVLKISGALMVLPFFLDVPLGILADKLGARILLVSGTVLQFVSLLGFFALPGKMAYISYLISIIIAENCYSGAEQSYLAQNLGSSEEVKDFLKSINQLFYYLTIPALLIGVGLYQIDPRFPLFAQLISFALAFISIATFKESSSRTNHEFEMSISNVARDVRAVFSSNQVIGLFLLSSVFAAIVQMSSKTIQGQVDFFSNGQTGTWLAISYVSSNLASGSSLFFWRKSRYLSGMSLTKQIFICFIGLLSAQIMMQFQNIFLISVGFIILSGIKSVYRPIFSGEIIHGLRHLPRLATKLSIVSTLTMIGVALFHIYSGWILSINRTSLGVFCINLILVLVFFIGFWVFKRPQTYVSFSGKKNSTLMVNDQKIFRQVYPEGAQLPDYELVRKISSHWMIKVPKLVAQTQETLDFEYITHQTCKNLSAQEQEVISVELLNNQAKTRVDSLNTSLQGKEPVNGSEFIDYLCVKGIDVSGMTDQRFVTFTHGDLNPNNILKSSSDIILADWDLLDLGYSWFDGLSLMTHPELNLTMNQRIEILHNIYHFGDAKFIRNVIAEFCRYKYEILCRCESRQLRNISKKYLNLSLRECM